MISGWDAAVQDQLERRWGAVTEAVWEPDTPDDEAEPGVLHAHEIEGPCWRVRWESGRALAEWLIRRPENRGVVLPMQGHRLPIRRTP